MCTEPLNDCSPSPKEEYLSKVMLMDVGKLLINHFIKVFVQILWEIKKVVRNCTKRVTFLFIYKKSHHFRWIMIYIYIYIY